jgi:hypothetical protein
LDIDLPPHHGLTCQYQCRCYVIAAELVFFLLQLKEPYEHCL